MNRTLVGFLVAPIVPVFLFSLSAGAYFFILLLVGIPAAYIGAFVIGAPLFHLYKKLNCLSWPFFLIGGVICSLPFGWFYSGGANTHLEIYGLRNMMVFFAIGAAGGITFWFISVRSRFEIRRSFLRESIGVIGVVIVSAFSLYVYYLGTSESLEGKMPGQNIDFLSSSSREVKIELSTGIIVNASLPANLPFRPGCPIYVTVRRSYLTSENLYWVNGYKDSPFVNVWQILEQSKKDDIPRSCD